MNDADRLRLRFGPYRMPRCKVGGRLRCRLRGRVKVVAISDSLIPWPMGRNANGSGRAFLIVTGSLVRAVQTEAAQAVMHWWGVKHHTVWTWKKAVGAPSKTAGSRQVMREWSPELDTPEWRAAVQAANQFPERAAKIAASKRGKFRPPHVQELLRTAQLGKTASDETRRKMREAVRRPPSPDSKRPPWTAAEDALLGTMVDREVAARVGRSPAAVAQRRIDLEIPSFRGQNGYGACRGR